MVTCYSAKTITVCSILGSIIHMLKSLFSFKWCTTKYVCIILAVIRYKLFHERVARDIERVFTYRRWSLRWYRESLMDPSHRYESIISCSCTVWHYSMFLMFLFTSSSQWGYVTHTLTSDLKIYVSGIDNTHIVNSRWDSSSSRAWFWYGNR